VKILITGGGTGGHVAPAIAVVAELRTRSPQPELLYVGSATGIEAKLSAEQAIPFTSVATGKLRRSANPLKMLNAANIRDVFRVPLGFVQAFGVVRRFRPDAVLSTGGYVCVPTVLAAAIQRVPVLTHEQTTTVGLANRIAGRFAQRIALTFEESRPLLSKKLAAKSVVTGNPLRAELFAGDRTQSARFGFVAEDAHLPLVYVTGGAQGARVINRAVAGAASSLLRSARVLHQTGTADEDELRQARNSVAPELAQRWQQRTFIEQSEIGDAWAIADVVVARAGAGTVTELCALGKAGVFVPLEPTSGDEQLNNARRCEAVGGAVVVRQADCSADTLLSALEPILRDADRRASMGAANQRIAAPNAAATLATMVIDLAERR
jgi:UDP-N-acetylglucosamine--N-acetylmuramyl-(pentapeptide) pyrophosphoryl-undecaprenol N-acetylglucosamine transferase